MTPNAILHSNWNLGIAPFGVDVTDDEEEDEVIGVAMGVLGL